MSSFRTKLPSLVISNGQTLSNVLPGFAYADAIAVQIYSPATLPETVTIELSPDYELDAVGNVIGTPTWYALYDDDTAAAIAVAPAGNVRPFFQIPGTGALRLKSGVAVAGDRTFPVTKLIGIDRM